MTRAPASTDGLPESLIDVAETLGLRVALRLIEVCGGQEVKFPKSPPPDHPIIKALGEEDGFALCRFLGGGMIYVPHARARAVRHQVGALEGQGLSRAQIARRLGISQRHVRRVANGRTARNPDQPDLFHD
ncbi:MULTISPECIES: helix-turn-helix domain-containing protein [Rhodovulum]|uniref:Helix-turn-helix domain-containing protein n=2 Tax=Rhodovulum TaxID=34008 RepID=A0A844BAQ4_9RHOB|nr:MULTISPECIES: helix-turn-helix domain-containing protein [Rhodovulum]MRH22670.1 helix-turn-helix domain-containing protein [Rhodovulum strictum]TCM84799.1 Mor family transcriptional regulator [Rhodovulum steppense]